MTKNRKPGDSSEQRLAEEWLRAEASRILGVELGPRRIDLESGSYMLLDGVCDEPRVLCEMWSHVGPPKSAQKHKVMADALKLHFARERLESDARCVLVFADGDAARPFIEGTWMAECLDKIKVEWLVIPLPRDLHDAVAGAQKRQKR